MSLTLNMRHGVAIIQKHDMRYILTFLLLTFLAQAQTTPPLPTGTTTPTAPVFINSGCPPFNSSLWLLQGVSALAAPGYTNTTVLTTNTHAVAIFSSTTSVNRITGRVTLGLYNSGTSRLWVEVGWNGTRGIVGNNYADALDLLATQRFATGSSATYPAATITTATWSYASQLYALNPGDSVDLRWQARIASGAGAAGLAGVSVAIVPDIVPGGKGRITIDPIGRVIAPTGMTLYSAGTLNRPVWVNLKTNIITLPEAGTNRYFRAQ